MTEMHQKKLLLLHGGHQTGEVLLGRIAKLRKKLMKSQNIHDKNNTKKNHDQITENDIILPTPLQIVAPDGLFESNLKELMRIWWKRIGENADCEYQGLEESMYMLHDLWISSTSFTGIFAFSQGARLAHLISVLHCNSSGVLFPGLEFVVFASGYYAPLPSNFPPNTFSSHLNDALLEDNLSIPSLHVIGKRDELITPEQSYELASKYQNAEIHEHQMGHCVPMKAHDVRTMLSFIVSTLNDTANTQKASNDKLNVMNSSETFIMPDEEHAQIQMEECESLELIYPEQFRLQSLFEYIDPNDLEGGKQYTHPIQYTMSLENDNIDNEDDDGFFPVKPLALQIQYTPNYPDELPKFSLQHDMNLLEFKDVQEKACIKVVKQIAEAELGMPCIMSCILAMREFIDEGGLKNCLTDDLDDNNIEGRDSDEIQEEKLKSDGDEETALRFEFLPSVSRKRMEDCDAQGQEIAQSIFQNNLNAMKKIHDSFGSINTNSAQINTLGTKSSKGGEWKYTIGLVGKPSAGKSTFFNAASAFARQRNDDVAKEVGEEGNATIFGASMAPHPFTTIDPNIGFCLVPAPPGACPEDNRKQLKNDGGRVVHSVLGKIGSTHGRDNQGRRFLPVTLKDVAGLVPGAYQGRGKGNKFLNDLTDADVLIHVVDASGSADAEGNQVGEGVHPLKDLAWIRNELFEWIYGNVANKWSRISRRGKDKLLDMFSGYKQTQAFLLEIMSAIDSHQEKEESEGPSMSDLHKWDQGDLRRLISAYLGLRFPMALALNKSDKESAAKFVTDIIDAIPVHGARVGVPLSARAEMNFMKHQILTSNQQDKTLKENVDIRKKHENGVWQCLQAAICLREPILVFPVSDMTTYESYLGMDDYATRDASLPSLGMISCLKAANGDTPTLWNDERNMYIAAKENKSEPLRDVFVMKQGSTVDNVYHLLKKMGAISGEFVRAEAVCNLGDKPKLVSKHECMGKHNRIIKVMTTKRSQWQKK